MVFTKFKKIMSNSIDRKKIESLLPHREPMLLIDKLTKIVPLKSATAIMFVKKKYYLKIPIIKTDIARMLSRVFVSAKGGDYYKILYFRKYLQFTIRRIFRKI